MDDDRELLELAAKAAELPVEFEEGDCNGWYPLGRDEDGDVDHWWNPLTDDGDALRLAVKLNLFVMSPVRKEDWAVLVTGGSQGSGRVRVQSDPYQATRRAIVLCAAQIGKSLT